MRGVMFEEGLIYLDLGHNLYFVTKTKLRHCLI